MNDFALGQKHNRLPTTLRLKGRKAIGQVLRAGRAIDGGRTRLIYLPAGPSAFTIIVGKKTGGAVRRNRVKRIIREFMRQNKNLWPQDTQLVIKINDRVDDERSLIDSIRQLLQTIAKGA